MAGKVRSKSEAKAPLRKVARGRSKSKNITVQSEEECLYFELEELGKDDPEWYRPNLIAGAKQLLRDGNSPEKVAIIYGEKITQEAQEQYLKPAKTSFARAHAASMSSRDKVVG